MTAQTRQNILNSAKTLFAGNGYEGFSIRLLAQDSGVGLSSIYHFFKDKDEILDEIFVNTGKQLGVERSKLPNRKSANTMLLDRIIFQFQHIEDIVFVLKFYLHFRPNFLKLNSGYIPTKAYLHVKEVLMKGVLTGEFNIRLEDIDKESKVIAHAINGYLLEYYPDTPSRKELKEVCGAIHQFIIRSLTNKGVNME